MDYYKIEINEINGKSVSHELDGRNFDKVTSWLINYMTNQNLDFTALENKEIFVDHYTKSLGKRRVMNYEITKENYGMIKINAKSSWNTEKAWAFDPKTNLRTIWGNDIHEDWIFEDVQKELEDKIRRLERLQ